MRGSTFNALTSSHSRVFVIEGRARPDHRPDYYSTAAAGAVSQSFGDVTTIEVPDPLEWGKFIEVGTIRGGKERATVSLSGRYAVEIKSKMIQMANRNCRADVQINFGTCTNASKWNIFEKKLILEDAHVTSYDTDDLGTLASDDNSEVNETIELSARDIYEIVQVSWSERAGDIITNEVIDVTHGDLQTCGDCEEESFGCEKFFAVTAAAGGSPSTPADVLFTLDGGNQWLAHDVDSLDVSADASAVLTYGDYLVVASQSDESIHYASLVDFDGVTDPLFTEVTTGIVSGAGPTSMVDTGYRLIAGAAGGYIYATEDPTDGFTSVLESGVLTVNDILDIDSYGDGVIVAGCENGVVLYSLNGETFDRAEPVAGVGVDVNAVHVHNEDVWMVGTNDGYCYYTTNAGTSWNESTFHLAGTGSVEAIEFSNDTVGYMSHTTASGNGRILRTTNGGYDWMVVPEGSGVLPANDRVNALAPCPFNSDVVVGVGLGDGGSDGYLVVGSD